MFLPADKGNAMVVMRRGDYEAKMRELIESPTYRCIRKDPTAMHETRLNGTLRSLRKNDEITEGLYHELRPTGGQPPRIYGLPKIHKPNVPLRPIVACIGSPSY